MGGTTSLRSNSNWRKTGPDRPGGSQHERRGKRGKGAETRFGVAFIRLRRNYLRAGAWAGMWAQARRKDDKAEGPVSGPEDFSGREFWIVDGSFGRCGGKLGGGLQ